MLIIFDMDGTLFQAKPVWLYANSIFLREMGIPVPPEETLLKSAGIGLNTYLRNTLPKGTDLLAARSRYLSIICNIITDIGELYPGIHEVVTQLHSENHQLCVCSNSPIEYLYAVLESGGLSDMFKLCSSNEGHESKTDTLSEVLDTIEYLQQNGKINYEPPPVFIGDTHGDITAAHANNIQAIAATYGYGNVKMLKDADFFANTPTDIPKCIKQASKR